MVLNLSLLAPGLIAFIAGLLINSFIIVVNVNDWLRGRSMTPVDQVVTSLGISRMSIQCVFTTYLLVVRFFLKNLYLGITVIILDLVYALCIYSNVWLTSLLSIVFCLKISSLHTRLFLYLRRMIEQRTPHLIVASGLLSFLILLLPFFSVITELTKGGTYNTTSDYLLMACSFKNSLYFYIVGVLTPLFSYIISSVLLFTSLYHHTRRMEMSGNLSINLETYYSAMKFVSITFIYSSVYIIGYFFIASYYYLYCVRLPLLNIVLIFLPALHSSYLIYRTAKLRSQLFQVLQNVMDFLFQRKDPETREEIEMGAQ